MWKCETKNKMKHSLKLGLAALAISAATLLSGCEICSSGCTSARRLPPAQGCYQPSCPTGCYQPSQCYQPAVSVCSPAQ